MRKNSIYNCIKNYNLLKRSSFHTPGHKSNDVFKDRLALEMDITELPDTDDLYNPTSCINASETKATKFYGSKKTLFSAGGNTLCIQTMLKLVCDEEVNHVIFTRNVHRSVVNTMALLNIIPHFVIPQNYLDSTFSYCVNPEDILDIIKKNKNIKAVFVTSPDYYGNILNVEEIAKVCKKFDIPLLVDNAHGSHLMCIDKNLHPINQGASLVADSIHKTLPALTGSALLHVMDEKFTSSAKYSMSIFGSTSPSFLILSYLDLCMDWIINSSHKEFKIFVEKINYIKKLAYKKNILLKSTFSDPARITLHTSNVGYTGYEFREYLYKYNIEPEHCDSNYCILIPSPFNKNVDFERLENAILNLVPKKNTHKSESREYQIKLPQNTDYTVRGALFSETITIPVSDSMGRYVSKIIAPCPPGIPLLIPGEKIGKEEQSLLTNCGITKVDVIK